jgi:simple sugar transport system ATP-binding protein
LKKLASEGTSILYISHKLKEIADLCDTASVLRKGAIVGEYDPKKMTARELGEIMVGQPLFEPKRPVATNKSESVLSVKINEVKPDTQFGVTLKNIDLEVISRKYWALGVLLVMGKKN